MYHFEQAAILLVLALGFLMVSICRTFWLRANDLREECKRLRARCNRMQEYIYTAEQTIAKLQLSERERTYPVPEPSGLSDLNWHQNAIAAQEAIERQIPPTDAPLDAEQDWLERNRQAVAARQRQAELEAKAREILEGIEATADVVQPSGLNHAYNYTPPSLTPIPLDRIE